MGASGKKVLSCLDESGRVGRIILSGEFVGESSAQLEKTFMDVQSRSEHVVFDLSGVSRLDMKSVFSICSLHRSLLRLNKACSLSGGSTALFTRVMGLIMHPLTGRCALDCREGCIWSDAKWLRDKSRPGALANVVYIKPAQPVDN